MVTTQMTAGLRATAVPNIILVSPSGAGVTQAVGMVRSLTVRAIIVDVDCDGSCSACGASWLCQQARLAEHYLAVW